MGVAKSSRFKDLVQNLWEGEFSEGYVFELLDKVKVTPQYLVNLDDRYNAQIAKMQSIDELLELEKNLNQAKAALEQYLAACKGSKAKWAAQKVAAEAVLEKFSPLFLGIELKLFEIAEAEMRKCGGKLSKLLQAKDDFPFGKKGKAGNELVDALCEFQSVTIGDESIASLDRKKMRKEIEAQIAEMPKEVRQALQSVVLKGALLTLVERFSSEFKSEKMVKIAEHFSKEAIVVEPDASASAIVIEWDKKKLHIVVSFELVTSVPSEELARGIYDVELRLSPAKKGGYELKKVSMMPSEQVV